MRIALFVICALMGFSALSQTPQEIPDSVFSLIYRQKYNAAERLLLDNKANIDPIYFAVLEIDMSYWKNVTGTSDRHYAKFETLLKSYQTTAPETRQQKAIELIRLSYQLRYELKRFQLFNAISTRKETLQLFNELKKDSTQLNKNQQELFELYQALITYFDLYLKPFFAKKKHAQTEILTQTMDKLTTSDQQMVKTLSTYFLGKIYLKYENKPQKAHPYLKWLQNTYPENQTFRELFSECKS